MQTKIVEPHTSSLGMNANIASIICFVAVIVLSWIPVVGYFAFVVPIVFFFIEKKSDFVRYNAVNAFVLYAVEAIFAFLLNVVITGVVTALLVPHSLSDIVNGFGTSMAVLGIIGFISIVIALLFLVLAIFCIINASSYKEFRMPVLGCIADKVRPLLEKMNQQAAPAQDNTVNTTGENK